MSCCKHLFSCRRIQSFLLNDIYVFNLLRRTHVIIIIKYYYHNIYTMSLINQLNLKINIYKKFYLKFKEEKKPPLYLLFLPEHFPVTAKQHPCYSSHIVIDSDRNFSASKAAIQPLPAAVIACLYILS